MVTNPGQRQLSAGRIAAQESPFSETLPKPPITVFFNVAPCGSLAPFQRRAIFIELHRAKRHTCPFLMAFYQCFDCSYEGRDFALIVVAAAAFSTSGQGFAPIRADQQFARPNETVQLDRTSVVFLSAIVTINSSRAGRKRTAAERHWR